MAEAKKTESLPAVVDPEVDAAMAWLDKAARALVEADVASAKAARDGADAAVVLARHKRAGEVHRKAVEVKLRAEARLGQLAGPALEGKAATAAASAARSGTVSPAETRSVLDEIDRRDIAKCRKVFGASSHLSSYLAHVHEAGEEPTRAGFLSFAKARDEIAEAKDAQARAAAERKKATEDAAKSAAKAKVIDTSAVVTTGRMSDAGSKPAPTHTPIVIPPPKGAPPRSIGTLVRRPANAYAPAWFTAIRQCIGAIENAPAPEGWLSDDYCSLLNGLGELEEQAEALVKREGEALRGKAS